MPDLYTLRRTVVEVRNFPIRRRSGSFFMPTHCHFSEEMIDAKKHVILTLDPVEFSLMCYCDTSDKEYFEEVHRILKLSGIYLRLAIRAEITLDIYYACYGTQSIGRYDSITLACRRRKRNNN